MIKFKNLTFLLLLGLTSLSVKNLHATHNAKYRCIRKLHGHRLLVNSVSYAPDGKTLASGSRDKSVKIWDTATYQCLRTLRGHHESVWSVCYAPDGKTLASASWDKSVKIWDARTGKCLCTLQEHRDGINSVCYAPDGTTLASASADKLVKIWDTGTYKCISTLKGHKKSVWSVCYAPDGKTLASASEDRMVKIWHIATGKCLRVLKGHTSCVLSVRYAPDGKILATVSDDKSVKIWDMNTGQCLHTLWGHSAYINNICYAPDTKASDFLTSGYCKKYSGQPLIPAVIMTLITKYLVHQGGILAVAGGYDKNIGHTVKIWDTNTGQCLHRLKVYLEMMFAVCYAPNGRTLASGGSDGIITIWDVDTEEPVRTLSKNYFMHYVKRCFTSRAFKAAELAIGSVLIAKNIKTPSDKPYKSRFFLGAGMVLVTDALRGFYYKQT